VSENTELSPSTLGFQVSSPDKALRFPGTTYEIWLNVITFFSLCIANRTSSANPHTMELLPGSQTEFAFHSVYGKILLGPEKIESYVHIRGKINFLQAVEFQSQILID
jgi:hypothetical protein